MELRVSSRRPRMSYESDHDDKETSDDDDRNHKHRRRDGVRSHLFEDEVTGHVVTKPYRRGSKPFQNGDLSVKFDKKGPGLTQFSDDPGAVRGRGRGSSQWSPREPRFGSFDLISQMVHHGSVPHGRFAGRGSGTVSNSDVKPWSPFGLVQGISNGGQDMFHSFGLQGTYRPAINCSLNTGLASQQCRDFEEQGFCLKGDMCPMEHGMNRIVVEDVQSLSQFNLPISLTSANLSITPVETGPTHATSVVTNTLSNSKHPHGKNIKHRIGDIDSSTDFYDPDQPLWSNDSHTSTELQSTSQQNDGKVDSLFDDGLSGDHHVGQLNNLDSSLKVQSRNGRINHKPSQKAERTLFVNGIPHQNNKRELLHTHFKKFGEVIKIHIPLNSERAFVQFSKREEAEAALMAPDAVMSNRFIKLWWANRDIIHDFQTPGGHNMSIPIHGLKVSLVNSIANKRKDFYASVSASDHPKPLVVDGKKVNSPLQKKLESLDLLKEELRKKQEMLDQKRNDFRLKLDKLEKHATGPKGEKAPEQLARKQNLGDLANSVKAATPSGHDHDGIVPSAQHEVAATGSTSVGPFGKQSFKTNLVLALPESSSLKSSPCSLVNLGLSAVNKRFKLDNRPTAFKVVPPLPDGLADVPVLKEHFSPYGDLSKVQVNSIDPKTSNVHIYFRTRHAAEKAFLGGKSWKGHTLQFVWLISSNSRKDVVTSRDSPKSTSEQPYASRDGDSEKTKGNEIVTDDTV